MTTPYRTPGERHIPAKNREWPWSKWSPLQKFIRAHIAIFVPINVIVWILAAYSSRVGIREVGLAALLTVVAVVSSCAWFGAGSVEP